MDSHKFPYRWTLKDANFTKDKGKVFSCFACGGGSTMGYKLAGFDVVGCNEIDPRVNKVYVANHHPHFNFLEAIQTFKTRKDLPKELYNLDILDGSPPCSSFSTAGNRDEDWGKEKKFREGQVNQVLDTLFFDFIDLAKELQPKVVIAENVKGLLLGEAIGYVRKIYDAFQEAGYMVCHTLCNASLMGVPQRRERVFFTAVRKDLFDYVPQTHDLFDSYPKINLSFNEPPILFREFYVPGVDDRPASQGKMKEYWDLRQPEDTLFSDTIERNFGLYKCFTNSYIKMDKVCQTITSNSDCVYLYDEYRKPNREEVCCISSFPQDYDFLTEQYYYICGMSVPPVMMAQVALRIYEQWLVKINDALGTNKPKIKEPVQLSLFD